MLSVEELEMLITLLEKAGKDVMETGSFVSVCDENDIEQHLVIDKMKEVI